jgi:fused signal recognition particle receptor
MEEKKGWFTRLKQGLSKSSSQLADGVVGIFTKRKLDAVTLEELEELLIRADMGVNTAAKLCKTLAKDRFDKEISTEEIRRVLAEEISLILEPFAKPFQPDTTQQPCVVMVVGVNGNGKTTTIGKIAHQLQQEGKRVMLCAADTFRAAAVEQLQIWGQRSGVEVITGALNSDPASVAFAALERARHQGIDVLLVDTAGRLQNKTNLMQELQKIVTVLTKLEPTAPHAVLQVLDATTGQNAISQVKNFKEWVKVSGLIVTKLDGTAKAGIVVALAEQFNLPIHAIGVGEGIEDFRAFDAHEFARSLVGGE